MELVREDKREICELLVPALQATRGGSEVVNIVYSGILASGAEFATILTKSGELVADVTADSGFALIRDILRRLE